MSFENYINNFNEIKPILVEELNKTVFKLKFSDDTKVSFKLDFQPLYDKFKDISIDLENSYLFISPLRNYLKAKEIIKIEKIDDFLKNYSDFIDDVNGYINNFKTSLMKFIVQNKAEALITGTSNERTENFKDVYENWYRFSHFNGESDYSEEKKFWRYDENTKQIYSTFNTESYVGFISPEKYDKYSLECCLQSTGEDNDVMGIVIAFIKDENNEEHTLSLTRSLVSLYTEYRFQLVYDFGKNDEKPLNISSYNFSKEETDVLLDKHLWNAYEKTKVKVIRDGDLIKLYTADAGSKDLKEETEITYNLSTKDFLNVFRCPCSYGYSCKSQTETTFSDVIFKTGDENSNKSIILEKSYYINKVMDIKDYYSNYSGGFGIDDFTLGNSNRVLLEDFVITVSNEDSIFDEFRLEKESDTHIKKIDADGNLKEENYNQSFLIMRDFVKVISEKISVQRIFETDVTKEDVTSSQKYYSNTDKLIFIYRNRNNTNKKVFLTFKCTPIPDDF